MAQFGVDKLQIL